MKIALIVLINKFITRLCKLLGKNGSVYPGGIIYDYFDKNILDKIKYPKYVIAVTGSSGKGSTTDLIYKVLTDNGYKVAYNNSGSNGILGAITLILNNCSLKGKFKKDVLLFETDERHLKLIFNKKFPTHIVFTNITRDQPSRNIHPEYVFKELTSNLNSKSSLIINADDPLINTLKYNHKGEVITYGIDKTKNSYTSLTIDSVDFAYCPFCHSKLKYEYYHYGHLGLYSCPNDDFKRGKVTNEAYDINLKERKIKIKDSTVFLNKDIIYSVYNTLAAYSLCREIDIPHLDIVNSINKFSKESKRGKIKKYQNHDFIMLESKNENSLSYYQSLRYIKDYEGKKDVILGFNNVSRRYNHNDISWLYDVEFELLNDEKIENIYCIGRFRYDVANRLSYANIDKDKITMIDDTNNILKYLKGKNTIFSIVCFDMTDIINKELEEYENENN